MEQHYTYAPSVRHPYSTSNQIIYLGYAIIKYTVKNILIENGFDPEPDLKLKPTWDVLTACDFFTIELLTGRRLVRCTLFFVIELSTRKVFFASIQPQPDGKYMHQVARILTDYEAWISEGQAIFYS